jgi:hypothetical protein
VNTFLIFRYIYMYLEKKESPFYRLKFSSNISFYGFTLPPKYIIQHVQCHDTGLFFRSILYPSLVEGGMENWRVALTSPFSYSTKAWHSHFRTIARQAPSLALEGGLEEDGCSPCRRLMRGTTTTIHRLGLVVLHAT